MKCKYKSLIFNELFSPKQYGYFIIGTGLGDLNQFVDLIWQTGLI